VLIRSKPQNHPSDIFSATDGSYLEGIGDVVYFPLTADPTGFHHLLLAECVLRQIPDLKQVEFILSNGFHPDPTKRKRIPDFEIRLSLLRQALVSFADPKLSYPARLAMDENSPVCLKEENWAISSNESEWERPVRLAEHVVRLKKEKEDYRQKSKIYKSQHDKIMGQRISMLVGTDLLNRMLDKKIFSNEDLKIISESSLLLVMPRGRQDLPQIINELRDRRGFSLQVGVLDPNWIPQPLRVLLNLSSTVIRRSVQAGQPLLGFMPESASDLIQKRKLYKSDSLQKTEKEWLGHCQELEMELESCANKLLLVLDDLENQGKKHTISFIESGTGGRIAAAFTAVPGVSRHLNQVLVPYSRESQLNLLGTDGGQHSTVSDKRARALAKKFQKLTDSDWVLAETGMAGPLSPERKSRKNGLSYVALAKKKTSGEDSLIQTIKIEANPFFSKKEHQLQFSVEALNWVLTALDIEKS
jgi:PncC family amidohydrolase